MKLKLIPFLIYFFCSGTISAQYGRSEAYKDLKDLKEGVLLIRLSTQENTISILEAQGKTKEAETLREKQYQENRDILLSFSKSFDFSKVYFFYSKDSEDIRNGNFSGKLFNSELEKTELNGHAINYFTGEFSKTENLGIYGLIIMNSKLLPLEAPFPFFQRKHQFLGLVTNTKSQMVEKLNQQMHDTYEFWLNSETENKAKSK